MLQLVIMLECDVEDIDEAKAKANAVKAVLEVYPFVKVTATISGKVDEED